MISTKLSLLVNILLVGSISCQTSWPTFHFYSRANPTVGVQVTAQTLASTPGFNPSKEVKLLIHGFSSSQFSGSITKIRDQLNAHTDANVIVIDWATGAQGPNYFSAAPNTKTVGAKTADFLRTANIPKERIHCIGHSLGAHACGFTGKNYKVGRISGLDPAGPLFAGATAPNRLAVGDADLTVCLHTDNSLGIQQAICDKNYYPNGGKFQTGCPTIGKREDVDPELIKFDPVQYELDTMVYHLRLSPDSDEETDIVGCSHNRAPSYFAESVGKCGFSSTPCDSYDNFQKGNCKCHTTHGCSSMGFCSHHTPELANFYLDTNPSSPFSKN